MFLIECNAGLGWSCRYGGESAREQMDSCEMRLPGELQCGIDTWRIENGRLGSTVATVS